eukprot:3048000-Pleurochrysis_carterae.AAC.1
MTVVLNQGKHSHKPYTQGSHMSARACDRQPAPCSANLANLLESKSMSSARFQVEPSFQCSLTQADKFTPLGGEVLVAVPVRRLFEALLFFLFRSGPGCL